MTTFDNHHYDFHGACNYSLAQRGFTLEAELGVYGKFDKCFSVASCVDTFTFVNDPHTVVTLNQGALDVVSDAAGGWVDGWRLVGYEGPG